MLPFQLEQPRVPKAFVGYGTGRATVLLVAECVGTGVLALPGAAAVVGALLFVLLVAGNAVLQIYAGSLLSWAAEAAERRACYAACNETTSALHLDDRPNSPTSEDDVEPSETKRPRDLVELAGVVGAGRGARAAIAACWYGNLVLVLAQYLVVMARSLRLAVDLGSCDVVASLGLSCLVLLALAQLPTLAAIGKGAAQASLAAVVAILALAVAATPARPPRALPADDATPLSVFAAASALTFAMSTTKLFLNVRLEMSQPEHSRVALVRGVAAFTALYVAVALGTGRDSPPFLLDALPPRPRRLAAALLFCHVAVSFAMNQQVLAKTVERALGRGDLDGARWTALTAALTALSLIIALALPVFSDLVSLIGALTSGPLTFAIPAICYRLATRDGSHAAGVAFLVAATAALVCLGTAGALGEIADHGEKRAARGGARGFFCDDLR